MLRKLMAGISLPERHLIFMKSTGKAKQVVYTDGEKADYFMGHLFYYPL